MFDLTFMEKVTRWLTNTQVKVKSEVSSTNKKVKTVKPVLNLYYLEEAGTSSYTLRHTSLVFKIKYARTNLLKFSYFHREVKEWNNLPLNVRLTNSLGKFKSSLKSYL